MNNLFEAIAKIGIAVVALRLLGSLIFILFIIWVISALLSG